VISNQLYIFRAVPRTSGLLSAAAEVAPRSKTGASAENRSTESSPAQTRAAPVTGTRGRGAGWTEDQLSTLLADWGLSTRNDPVREGAVGKDESDLADGRPR
jgi:hypothetical protein